jgi:phage tail sheath protein FI
MMAYQLSPGVLVKETDLTTVVPAISTSAGGFVGNFAWGPAEEVTYVGSENELASVFGKPNANTYLSFFTAANFLAYSNQLLTIRAVGSAAKNAAANANTAATLTADVIKNQNDYDSATVLTNGLVSAKYPGSLGNSLKVVYATNGNWSNLSASYQAEFNGQPGTSAYAAKFGSTNDELHILVLDEDGLFTGTANTVVDKFQYLSAASDAVGSDGASIYYRNVLNNSNYLWWRGHPGGNSNWGTTASTGNVTYALTGNVQLSLFGGVDSDPSAGNIETQYSVFLQDDIYDVSLLPVGSLPLTNARNIVNNVAEVRKDCVVFISPAYASVQANLASSIQLTNVVADRTSSLSNLSSSYAVMDSGWKYQYDRYSDVYRWLPLNGDIAGLCARTDFVADPWFSPGGLNRGQIKNVVRLAFNPTANQRDVLYRNSINPVISVAGQGTVLYGDKTLLSKPSAFDRINVRRLFIVLEKAIASAAKYSLFEFNDAFTRAQFKNLVEPFLRDVRGRRGITDFLVVCDETNNTGEVIDRNEFVADIYIKPARSINFISLNFIATRSSISFNEVGA